MSLFQFTAGRLVSRAGRGLKAAASKKPKFCSEMARPSSSKAHLFVCFRTPCSFFKVDLKF